MNPVITIDARMLGACGIGTYLNELLTNLISADHDFRFKILCADPNAIHLRETKQNRVTTEAQRIGDAPQFKIANSRFKMGAAHGKKDACRGYPEEEFEFLRATAPIYSLREQWEIAHLVREGNLFHCPHYNIPYFYKGRMVVTIHDLTHLASREFVPSRLAYHYARFMLKAAAHHARQVITVSQFSRKSICEMLDVAPEKVHVISYGIPKRVVQSGPVYQSALHKLGVTAPYVLFVGLLKPHKNVQALIRAFAVLPEQLRTSHQLVIAGKLDSCYPALLQLARELSLSDRVIFTGYVTDEELRALYAGAKAFVLPSLNEGYGLPVLEAMANGVPVIVSNTSSLPEVTGEAGILVDPGDDQSICKALERVLTDEQLRKDLGERGRKRAQSFSTRDFALKHLEVYRMALA